MATMPLYRPYTDLDPIQLNIQIEATSDANLREYLDRQTQVYERMAATGRRCVAIMDNSIGDIPKATQRAMYAEWINATRPTLDAVLAGAAFVVPSMMVRGSLTAIFWLARLSAPHTVHKDLDGALTWALEFARTEGLRMHPELRSSGVEAFGAFRAGV